MPPVPPDLATALSDRYRIDRELGRGGMATVYLADDLKHRRKVAVKVMLPELAAAIGRDRFLREIGIAARLTHPHILPLYDSGAAGGYLYYVTPYIEGETLRARLSREKQLPLEDTLRLAREIASALGYAHHQGFVHRDVKPENILLAQGIALVADFGIARVVPGGGASPTADTSAGALTSTGMIVGTPRYMAPEQAGGGDVDARADLYALGCVVYEMLAGEPPFTSGSAVELIRQHLAVAARPVTELRPSVPAGVARAIARALAKLPADRPATAARFAESLGAGEAGTPTPAPEEGRERVPNNLPKQRTHFIGRERELAECASLLGDTRLLTLTGIGGCGKTRLALKLAENLLETFPDGVWFVDLAPLKDPDHVAQAVAAAVGVTDAPGTPLVDSIAEHVKDSRVLVLLDNCEHVLTASAGLADRLLASSRELRILATSREGLGVEGERPVALKSLGVPPPAADLLAIESADAVRLFLDRARVVDPAFDLTEKSAPVVAEICRRLDGIPLAIELAAARVKILSPEQIRSKLDDRFRLLTGGSKTALPRHQTLRATIGWSYDHLSGDEQRLFRRLSVFAGGWTLDLATRLAGPGADEFDMMDLLSRLVDKSLVTVERGPDTDARYNLLETVRQFAQERLTDAGEADAARQAHLEEFLALAETAYPERIAGEETWARLLEIEHDNVRAALETARHTNPERHLELAGAMAWFWQARSHHREGRDHLIDALAATPADPPRPARARALWGAALVTAWQGDGAGAIPLMEASLEMWRALRDDREVAIALEGLGYTQWLDGQDDVALRTFRECFEIQTALGDPALINRARVGLAQLLVAFEELDEVRAHCREILAFAASGNDRRSEHIAWHYQADCALMSGNYTESLSLYRKSLVLAHALGDRIETSFEIQGVAMSLAALGRDADAVRLADAVDAEFRRMSVNVHVRFWDRLLERFIGAARRKRGATGSTGSGGAAGFGGAAASGGAAPLSFDEAIRLCEGASGPDPGASATS